MTTRAEDTLYAGLTDVDALETLAKEGLDLECIPTEEMRPVVEWAIDRFFESGRTKAPSRALLLEYWQNVIEDAGVELLDESEEVDTIESAIEALKSHYVSYEFQEWLKGAANAMIKSTVAERVEMLGLQANALFDLSLGMQSRRNQATALEGITERLAAFRERATAGHQTRGMTFGIPEIDEHTYGIHPGELAVAAAGPKTGKSFFLTLVGLHEWKRPRCSVLFTLENSVEMTMDRLACQALGIDSSAWQRGTASPGDVILVEEWLRDQAPLFPGEFHVIMPDPSQRTMSSMVRQAQMLGADNILVDQLTFVDHPNPKGKGRPEIIRDLMHDLKLLISTGPQPLSCLMAHQINREGIKSASKVDHLDMMHMAEGSEVERTVDWAFGIWQSMAMRMHDQALFQTLAARREDFKWWELDWGVHMGHVSVQRERDIA